MNGYKRPRRSLLTLAAGTIFCLSAASALTAQAIVGTVTDARSGTPVGSGFVVLLDQTQNEVARSLWSRNGAFRIDAPSPGRYRLRTERIGYHAFVSEPVEVPVTGVVTLDLAIAGLPILLDTIDVTREDRCNVSPEQDAETAVVWEEIRKALAAASWTESTDLYHTVSNLYERDMDGRGRRVFREEHRSAIGYTQSPFVSRNPGLLVREGYVSVQAGGTLHFAPDAVVLQDEGFLQTHCFRLREKEEDGAHLIGLAFEPSHGRELPDVEGVLWLNRQTSELQLLEYTYTNLPYELPGRMTPGGTLEFLPLPGGTWIVHRWQIDLATRLREEWVNRFDRRPRQMLERRRESGGEVLTVKSQDGSVVYQAEVAELTGVLIDSMSATPEPLAGAVVRIVDTWFADTTDQLGRFRVEAPLDGEYSVSVAHPRTDWISFVSPSRLVTLARGRTYTIELAVPRTETVMAELCPSSPAGAYGRVIVGTVIDSTSGAPVAGAQVAASWQSIHSMPAVSAQNRERVVSSDEDGNYVFCGLEFGRPALVYALAAEAQSEMIRVCFEAGGVEVEDEFHETPHGIWRTDLTLTPTSASTTVLAGSVTDAITGEMIPDAVVTVGGFPKTATTDSRGVFRLVGPPPGKQQILLEASGYRTGSGEIDIEANQPTLLSAEFLTMEPVAQVAGTISDSEGGTPVAEVWVTLLSDSGTAVAMTRSDELGRYSLTATEQGSYHVLVRRIGFSPQRLGPFEVEPGHEFTADFTLFQAAVTLDPVTVTAEFVEGYLEDVGFYQRQRASAGGYFMDREEIEKRLGRVTFVEELLTGVMGVSVAGGVPGSFGAQLNFQRGRGFGGGECAHGPRVFVDGMVVETTPHISEGPGAAGATQYTTLSEVVRPEEVHAIEVYRTPSQIPAQYGGANSACGVLLIWTIHGRD